MLNEKPTETADTALADWADRVARPACACGHRAVEHVDAAGECVHFETDGYDTWPGYCPCSSYTSTESRAADCCISGVCDYHNALNIVAANANADRAYHDAITGGDAEKTADYAKFVAAARWLRANGWTYDRTDMGSIREWRWRTGRHSRISLIGYVGDGVDTLDICLPDVEISATAPSVPRSIAYLIAAKVLPAEFSSTSCTYCEVAR